jgi:hypothetical protein
MSTNSETLQDTLAAAQPAASVRKTYSRKRWNAFDTWQEHIRKSAAAVSAANTAGVAFAQRHDRDLRRIPVAG